jgi:hypothetical protein
MMADHTLVMMVLLVSIVILEIMTDEFRIYFF